MSAGVDEPVPRESPVPGWIGVGLLTLTGALAGLLEAMLVPLYVGSHVFPICLVAALVTNFALPRMGRALVPTTAAAVLPFLGWLVVIFGIGALGRPEGDVILPGGGPLTWVSYGLMLGGALVGTISIVLSLPAPAPGGRGGASPTGASGSSKAAAGSSRKATSGSSAGASTGSGAAGRRPARPSGKSGAKRR